MKRLRVVIFLTSIACQSNLPARDIKLAAQTALLRQHKEQALHVQWPESATIRMCLPRSSDALTYHNPVQIDVSYRTDHQSMPENFEIIEQMREQRWIQACQEYENAQRHCEYHSTQNVTISNSVLPLRGRPERTPRSALSNPHAKGGKPLWKPCAPKVAARLSTPNEKFEHSAQTTTVSAKAQNHFKTTIAAKNMLQQNSSIAQTPLCQGSAGQAKQLYTNYCSQLDNRSLNPTSYQIIDKRVRALKATLDHPGQLHERNIKLSAQERTELTKAGMPAAALLPLRGNAAQVELHEEYRSVFEQWAQKSHEIRRSLVQEHIAHIALQFAECADAFNRGNNLAGGYAMADVMHAAWQSVQEFFTLAKATAQVDYEVLGILGTSALDGALCAGCSTAQMVVHPLQTAENLFASLKTLGATIARVAYTADILLGDDEQRSAQTRAELYAMLKAAANELCAKAKSQHPLMTFSDCVSGGTQFVAEGVLASKCLTLSANVLNKSAQALNKLPALAKASAAVKTSAVVKTMADKMADRASGTKIRLPLAGSQREFALAHAQASIGEGFAEELAHAPKKSLASNLLKQEQQAAQKIPTQPAGASSGSQPQNPLAQPTKPVSSGLQPAVPEKPTVTTAFPGPLPAPGTQQLLKVFALPEQQRAAIIARYGKPIPEIGGACFTQPLHLIALDVRKIDQKSGLVEKWMGFHHDYRCVLERNNVISLPNKLDYGGGFYFVKEAKYGMQKPTPKSFFPADWPPEKVFEKVLEAYGNIKEIYPAEAGRQVLVGWLETEQKAIKIIIDKSKNIITAYPDLLKKVKK